MKEGVGRRVSHSTGLGIGVGGSTPNNGKDGGLEAVVCSGRNGSNYPVLQSGLESERLSCTDSGRMEEAPCELGGLGHKGARNRPPRCVLGLGGVQASRAQPRVGRASSCVSIPSEVVGSQKGSPSSDQAKLRNEKEQCR